MLLGKVKRLSGVTKMPKNYWIQSQWISLSGLRDRALTAGMLYSFAPVSAVPKFKVDDYYHSGPHRWLKHQGTFSKTLVYKK